MGHGDHAVVGTLRAVAGTHGGLQGRGNLSILGQHPHSVHAEGQRPSTVASYVEILKEQKISWSLFFGGRGVKTDKNLKNKIERGQTDLG